VPYFTSVTRSGVRVSMPYGTGQIPCPLRFDTEEPIYLPADAGQGIDLVAADVGSDCWAVCIGAGNDIGYLVRRRDRLVLQLGSGKVRGRYAVWIGHGGDVSWIPDSNPYIAEHLNGSTELSRDTHHPLSPDERVIHVWGPVRVVQTYRDGPWMVGEDTTTRDGETRIFAKHEDEAPRLVWAGVKGDGYCPLPAHLAAHPDGSCTVAVQLPDGQSGPVFVHSSAFSIYAAAAVRIPTFAPIEQMSVFVDSAPGAVEFTGINEKTGEPWPIHGLTIGVLCHIGHRYDAAEVKLAVETGHILRRYQDTHAPEFRRYAPAPLEDGRLPLWVPMVQLYRLPGEPLSGFDRRCRTSIEDAQKTALPVEAWILAHTRGGLLTEQEAIDGIEVAVRACVDLGVRGIAFYVYSRDNGRDGIVAHPGIAETVRRVVAACQKRNNYLAADELLFHVEPTPIQEPTEPAQPAPSEPEPPAPIPEPVPEPPAVPEPVPVEPEPEPPAPPKRKNQKTDKKPAIVGGIVVLGGLIAKWFGRKKSK
jgi:hypothetical protein